MKKVKKVWSVVAIAGMMLCIWNSPTLAVNAETAYPIYYAQTGTAEEIAPRMTYLTSVFTDMTIRGNRADCQGNYTTFQDVRVRLTVTLQRSKVNTTDNSYWSNVSGGSWSQTWDGPGQHIINRSKTNLTSGYYYRVQTNATVLSASNIPLETVIIYSVVSWY